MRLNRKAQMSLIMILVIALALVFYAVSINWSRISAYKTQVTLAANSGAATLVSMMASYGEYFLQGQMGGQIKKQGPTGTLVDFIIAAVLIVVAVVLAVVTWGAGAPVSGFFATAAAGVLATSAIIGAGLAVAAVVVDVAWVQPGLTKAWSKAIKNIPTIEGQYVEQGIQTMLTGVVNDDVMVEDRWDMDQDGYWYPQNTDAEKISRFAYYYSNRLNDLATSVPAIEALQKILLDMEIYLGLPQVSATERSCTNAAGDLLPQCNPCCQDPGLRPQPDCQLYTQAYVDVCADPVATPLCAPSSLNACYVYDPQYAKAGDMDVSLPAKLMFALGQDDPDPHSKLENGSLVPETGLFTPDIIYGVGESYGYGQVTYDGGVFRGTDATGKFFPMLWAFADSGAYVKDLWVSAAVDTRSPACHWRARDNTGAPVCELEVGAIAPSKMGQAFYRPTPPGTAYNQLGLSTACTYGECYINVFKNTVDPGADLSSTSHYDARRIDGVGAIAPLLAVADNMCTPDASGKTWKKGSDRYSQTFVEVSEYTPYSDPNDPNPYPVEVTITVSPIKGMEEETMTLASDCTGDGSNCVCGASPSLSSQVEIERWRSDAMDNASKALLDFSYSAMAITAKTPEEFQGLVTYVGSWGPELLKKNNALDQASNGIDPITTLLDTWISNIDTWQAGTSPYSYVGDDLWCLPSSQNDASITQQERNAILSGGATWGSLASVINCLNYNSSNYQRFNSCYTSCSCNNLPRSLVPGFDPNVDPGIYYALAVGWDDAFLTQIGFTRAQLVNISEADLPAVEAALTAARDAYVIPAIFYTTVTVDTYIYSMSEENQAIWVRIGEEDPELTADDYAAFNAELFPLVYPVETVAGDKCSSSDTPYMLQINDSRTLARNQSDKFRKRAAYLSDLRSRAAEVRNSFQVARTYLTTTKNPTDFSADFLQPAGPRTPPQMVRDIIAYIQQMSGAKSAPLGNDVVYGWFSPVPKGLNRAYGYLHLVKVQATVPGFRGDLLSAFPRTEDGSQVKPWIDTWTNWLGTRRYYELKDNTGYVAARVIRYDEDHGGALSFLSGLPLWQIMYRNPHVGNASPASLVASVYTNCTSHYKKKTLSGGQIAYDPDTYSNNDAKLKEGFMFDSPSNATNESVMARCKADANSLLQWGLGAETCAVYFPACTDTDSHGNPSKCTYDLRFVSCKK